MMNMQKRIPCALLFLFSLSLQASEVKINEEQKELLTKWDLNGNGRSLKEPKTEIVELGTMESTEFFKKLGQISKQLKIKRKYGPVCELKNQLLRDPNDIERIVKEFKHILSFVKADYSDFKHFFSEFLSEDYNNKTFCDRGITIEDFLPSLITEEKLSSIKEHEITNFLCHIVQSPHLMNYFIYNHKLPLTVIVHDEPLICWINAHLDTGFRVDNDFYKGRYKSSFGGEANIPHLLDHTFQARIAYFKTMFDPEKFIEKVSKEIKQNNVTFMLCMKRMAKQWNIGKIPKFVVQNLILKKILPQEYFALLEIFDGIESIVKVYNSKIEVYNKSSSNDLQLEAQLSEIFLNVDCTEQEDLIDSELEKFFLKYSETIKQNRKKLESLL